MPLLIVTRQPKHYTGEPLWERHAAWRGPILGQVIPLDAAEVVVGRDAAGIRAHHPDAAVLYLPLPWINRYHARFRRVGEGYVLEDMQSRNGTWVNGKRIGTVALQDGDRICMSEFEFVFQASDAAEQTAAIDRDRG